VSHPPDADVRLAQQTLRWQAAEQTAAAERARVAVLELAVRRSKNAVNREASAKALGQLAIQVEAAPTAIERARLRSQAAGIAATAARQELEDLEGAERAARHDEQLAAALASAADYGRKLEALDAAHGPLTAETYAALRRTAGLV
jgi:hypothetical protein